MISLPNHVTLRPMQHGDIPVAMKIKSIANWNQVESDWELFLSASNEGNFIALYERKEVGTVTTFTYQDKFSWIGMVLVDPAYRGLGIGSSLVQAAIRSARSKGAIRLDATPQGMKLYKILGFQVERELLRVERKIANPLPDPIRRCSPVDREALKKILESDQEVFGANREKVLHYLLNNAPQYAYYLEQNGKITGYCFGRSGSAFEHIGPIVSDKLADARDLLLTAIGCSQSKPLIIDLYTEHQLWLKELEQLGFTIQRPFIRMHLGLLNETGNISRQFAVTGPELG